MNKIIEVAKMTELRAEERAIVKNLRVQGLVKNLSVKYRMDCKVYY